MKKLFYYILLILSLIIFNCGGDKDKKTDEAQKEIKPDIIHNLVIKIPIEKDVSLLIIGDNNRDVIDISSDRLADGKIEIPDQEFDTFSYIIAANQLNDTEKLSFKTVKDPISFLKEDDILFQTFLIYPYTKTIIFDTDTFNFTQKIKQIHQSLPEYLYYPYIYLLEQDQNDIDFCKKYYGINQLIDILYNNRIFRNRYYIRVTQKLLDCKFGLLRDEEFIYDYQKRLNEYLSPDIVSVYNRYNKAILLQKIQSLFIDNLLYNYSYETSYYPLISKLILKILDIKDLKKIDRLLEINYDIDDSSSDTILLKKELLVKIRPYKKTSIYKEIVDVISDNSFTADGIIYNNRLNPDYTSVLLNNDVPLKNIIISADYNDSLPPNTVISRTTKHSPTLKIPDRTVFDGNIDFLNNDNLLKIDKNTFGTDIDFSKFEPVFLSNFLTVHKLAGYLKSGSILPSGFVYNKYLLENLDYTISVPKNADFTQINDVELLKKKFFYYKFYDANTIKFNDKVAETIRHEDIVLANIDETVITGVFNIPVPEGALYLPVVVEGLNFHPGFRFISDKKVIYSKYINDKKIVLVFKKKIEDDMHIVFYMEDWYGKKYKNDLLIKTLTNKDYYNQKEDILLLKKDKYPCIINKDECFMANLVVMLNNIPPDTLKEIKLTIGEKVYESTINNIIGYNDYSRYLFSPENMYSVDMNFLIDEKSFYTKKCKLEFIKVNGDVLSKDIIFTYVIGDVPLHINNLNPNQKIILPYVLNWNKERNVLYKMQIFADGKLVVNKYIDSEHYTLPYVIHKDVFNAAKYTVVLNIIKDNHIVKSQRVDYIFEKNVINKGSHINAVVKQTGNKSNLKPNLYFEPDQIETIAGKKIKVTLKYQNVRNLFGASIYINYDNTQLNFEGNTNNKECDISRDGGFFMLTNNPQLGKITIGATRKGKQIGTFDSGKICDLFFMVKGNSNSKTILNLNGSQLKDPDYESILFNKKNLEIMIK